MNILGINAFHGDASAGRNLKPKVLGMMPATRGGIKSA